MKLGISIKVDVTKIDKARLHKGEKGTYLDLTTFIDTDNPGRYGDHGFISQSLSKEEREAGVETAILGNCKVFYKGQDQSQNISQPRPVAPPPPPPFPVQSDDGPPPDYDDQGIEDVPF